MPGPTTAQVSATTAQKLAAVDLLRARQRARGMDKALFVLGLRDVRAWTDPPRWFSCRCGGSSLGVTVVPKLKRAAFAAMQGREPAPRFAILNP